MASNAPREQWPTSPQEVERFNDQLAREHSIDELMSYVQVKNVNIAFA